jgi:hypothetical protein
MHSWINRLQVIRWSLLGHLTEQLHQSGQLCPPQPGYPGHGPVRDQRATRRRGAYWTRYGLSHVRLSSTLHTDSWHWHYRQRGEIRGRSHAAQGGCATTQSTMAPEMVGSDRLVSVLSSVCAVFLETGGHLGQGIGASIYAEN